MTYKTLILLSTMVSSAMVHSSDIPVTWEKGQTPATLADGKLTLTYDGGGNVATIMATPAKDERIVIGGDRMAMAENATITMDNSAGDCGALVFRSTSSVGVTGTGSLTCRSATDDSVITWEADSKSTALDIAPNWKLLFPGKRLAEYEPVESNQDSKQGGKEIPSGPSNPNRMVARCITRGTDADGRDTMEFELQYGTSTYLKSVKIQLRQGEEGIEGVAVSAAYVGDLLASSVGDDIDYIATHKAQYPSWQNVRVWGPSHTATGLAYGTYVLTMRRTSGLPLVQFEKYVSEAANTDNALPLVIARGVEVKGAGSAALTKGSKTGGRAIGGQLTIADERSYSMKNALSGNGTLRLQRDVVGTTTNYFKNVYNPQYSTVQSAGNHLLWDLTNATAKIGYDSAGHSYASAFYNYAVAANGLVATGQVQYATSKNLMCVFVEFKKENLFGDVKVMGVKAGIVKKDTTHQKGDDFSKFADVTWTNFVNTTTQQKPENGGGWRLTSTTLYWKKSDCNLVALAGDASTYSFPNGGRIEIGGGLGGDEVVRIDRASVPPTNGVLEIREGGVGVLTQWGEGLMTTTMPFYRDGYSKGTCRWVVRQGGELWQAYEAIGPVGRNQEVELDGGTFYAAHEWTSAINAATNSNVNLSLLTMSDGAKLEGNLPLLAGYVNANAIWKIRGTSPSYCKVDVAVVGGGDADAPKPLTWDVWDVTGDDAADLVVDGALRRYTWRANCLNAELRKRGAGTVRLNGVCPEGTAYGRSVRLYDGTWLLGASGVTEASFQIEGGTLAAAEGTSNDVGSLTVAAAGAITVAEGAVLSFADSSAVTWTAGAGERVVVTADLTKNSVRFGTDANGLTDSQQRVLRNAAGKRVTLDENGWLRDGNFGAVMILR